MDEKYSFWYPVKVGTQLGLLPGFEQETEIILAGHIVSGKFLLCGRKRETIMSKLKAHREKTSKHRILGTETCKKCLDVYKTQMGIFKPVAVVAYEAKVKEETVSTPASA